MKGKKILIVVLMMTTILFSLNLTSCGKNVPNYKDADGGYTYNNGEFMCWSDLIENDYIDVYNDEIIGNNLSELGEGELIVSSCTKAIDYNAFVNCDSLKSLVFLEGTTQIRDRAFLNCNNLTNLVLPKSLTKVGDCVFDRCSLNEIFYAGDQEEFFNIENVENLNESSVYYYSEGIPTEEGKFWRYEEDGVACWDVFTITFKLNNGESDIVISGCEGVEVTPPSDPTRAGYTFAGWDQDIPQIMPAGSAIITAKWTPIQYTITYTSDADVPNTSENYTIEDTVTLESLTKTGHSCYWMVSEADGNWELDEKVAAGSDVTSKYGNVTLKEYYEVNKYTITFELDNGQENIKVIQDYGSTIPQPETPNKTAYTFAKWSREIPRTMPDENIIITAEWAPIQYTITYNSDSGVPTKTYTIEDTVTLESLTKDGYSCYWMVSEADGNWRQDEKVAAGNEITSKYGNITLKEHYEANQYTITYTTESDGIKTTKTYTIEDTVTLESLAKTGHSCYWMVSEADGNWELDEKVAAGSDVTSKYGNVTLKEYYEVNKYTITFELDNGEGDIIINEDYGTIITPPGTPNKTGYTFAKWSRDIPETMPDESITITAEWTPIQYTITYSTNSGNTNSTESYNIEENFALRSLSKKGCSCFWVVTREGGNWKIGEKYVASSQVSGKYGNVTLSEQYEENKYSIVYNSNKPIAATSVQGSMASQTGINLDSSVTLTRNKFVCNGWIFRGWSTTQKGEVEYEDNQTFSYYLDENIILYAVWEVDPLTVGGYVQSSGEISGTRQGDKYMLYRNLNEIPQSLYNEKIIIHLSNVPSGSLNMSHSIGISSSVSDLYLIGSTNKTFTNMMFQITDRDSIPLQINLKNFNFDTNGTYAIGYEGSSQCLISITLTGDNSITSSYSGGYILGLINQDLNIGGTGNLNLTAGKGKNGANAYGNSGETGDDGSDGGIAIHCANLYLTGSGILNFTGGEGGDGGTGATGQQGSDSINEDPAPTAGSIGGTGGSGGRGGIAVYATNIIIKNSDLTVTFIGGAGGRGGTGGRGGKGGNGRVRWDVSNFDGKAGGQGGVGGTGGTGAYSVSVPRITIVEVSSITFIGGAGGRGGTGGVGGTGGTGGIISDYSFGNNNAWGVIDTSRIKGIDGGKGGAGGTGGDAGYGQSATNTEIIIDNQCATNVEKTAGIRNSGGAGGAGGTGGDAGYCNYLHNVGGPFPITEKATKKGSIGGGGEGGDPGSPDGEAGAQGVAGKPVS